MGAAIPDPEKDIKAEPDSGLDIIQFAAPIYFVEEKDEILLIDIMRLGDLKGSCSVRYYSKDASAKAGRRYKACSGNVTFEEGEHTKTIEVRIISSRMWSTTLEFEMYLERPINCELDLYLHKSRVKVIDNDLFPSDKYARNIQKGEEDIEAINGVMLFLEYCKLNFQAE